VRIWKTYKHGQEVDKNPSPEYLAVAREIQEWIALNSRPIFQVAKGEDNG
jgi:hypothetical protein